MELYFDITTCTHKLQLIYISEFLTQNRKILGRNFRLRTNIFPFKVPNKSNATLVPESLTPRSTVHRSRTNSICSTDSRHSLTPNRGLIARLHHVKLATETSKKLSNFYKILNENGSRLMPDGNVSMAGLAKHFRIVANLEYLLDLIEGVAQGQSYEDESSKRSSTSRTEFWLHC